MRLFLDDGAYDCDELVSLNRVQRSKRCYSVADVATGNGLRIRADAFLSSQDELSSYTYPEDRPTRKDLLVWSRALRSLCHPSCFLRSPLGAWTRKPHKPIRFWYDEMTADLYEYRDEHWSLYRPLHSHSTRRGRSYGLAQSKVAPPKDVTPATAFYRGEHDVEPILRRTRLRLER